MLAAAAVAPPAPAPTQTPAPAPDTLEGATFRKYDTGDKGHLTERDASAMMAALGYDVGSEYIAGLLGIYGNVDGVLELEGFKKLSQSLGAEEDTETLENATFREYDAGGKGHLTAAELSALLKDLDYAVDAEYVAGLMEIYGGEGGAVERGAFRAGLDEGLLSLYRPHSRLYGESL